MSKSKAHAQACYTRIIRPILSFKHYTQPGFTWIEHTKDVAVPIEDQLARLDPDMYAHGPRSLTGSDWGSQVRRLPNSEAHEVAFHFTPQNVLLGWPWPECWHGIGRKADLFSPNLDKELHVGHLRQLVAAAGLYQLYDLNVITMWGKGNEARLGAQAQATEWIKGLALHAPDSSRWVAVSDTMLVQDWEDQKALLELPDPYGLGLTFAQTGKYQGCWMYDTAVAVRSDGRSTYVLHDLLLRHCHAPDLYLTGCEQTAHFAQLGLRDKHIPLGLVQNVLGQKLSSRNGETVTALDFFNDLKAAVVQKDDRDTMRLAWTLLCLNLAFVDIRTNVVFDGQSWCQPTSKGMRVAYCHARYNSIWEKLTEQEQQRWRDMSHDQTVLDRIAQDMTEQELKLFGFCAYEKAIVSQARHEQSLVPIANWVLALTELANAYYEDQPILLPEHTRSFAPQLLAIKIRKCLARGIRLLGGYPPSRIDRPVVDDKLAQGGP